MKPYLKIVLFILSLVFIACSPKSPSYDVEVFNPPGQADLHPTQKPYAVNGKRYEPIPSAEGFVEEGLASWYGKDFHGRKTSNGEIYDMYAMTAAHKTLPMNVFVKVTNLNNNRFAIVRVNDRGPFVKNRIIDLSYTAANKLDVVSPGTAPVKIEALGFRERSSRGQKPQYSHPKSYDLGPYTIQVGAFSIEDNAHRLADQLRPRFGAASVAEGWVKGKKFYRVRVGLYESLSTADKARHQIESNGFRDSFIVAKE